MKRRRLRLLQITSCLLLAALLHPVQAMGDDADDTIGTYMKKNRTATDPGWRNLIIGIGTGFWIANKELIRGNQAPLFCFGGGYEPNPIAVLDAWIAKERARWDTVRSPEYPNYPNDGLQVQVAMLIAYEDTFPCPARQAKKAAK